ncbi:MAG TPA: M14 family zinc carboxypeptidase, partial [Burkholderiales bacterium]|nr:M14 family zinc carboxypeptidase [Burkholderiales bacterium]
DGLINEDSEGYVDPNRQWGFDWAPEYVQSGSGNYPFQAVGLKALALWTQTKTNICVGWTFHNFGGMYLRGPSRKGVGEYPPQDVAVYDYIGKQAERITPGYRYMISWKDLYTTYGDSLEWLCQTLGAYGYCGEVYQSSSEAFKGTGEKKTETPAASGEESPRSFLFGDMADRERLKYSDNLTQGELYKPWKPFKHPVYGDIEIGGWVKMSSRLGPAFMLPDLVHRNAMAVLFSAKHTPTVELEVTEVKKLGSDLYRVRTRLANGHAMPTMSFLAQKTRIYPKDMLKVSGPAAKVVAGGLLTNAYTDQVAYKRFRPDVQFMVVPGFGKTEYQFLVQGKGEITVRYESRHGGTLEKKVKLD